MIAIFYSSGIEAAWLLGGLGFVAAMIVLRMAGVISFAPYVVLGVALWFAIEESGVHATIAGVALGLLTPARPFRRPELIDADELSDLSSVEAVRETTSLARQSVSVVEYLEDLLHRWMSLVIVPLFALANAGVVITGGALTDAVVETLSAKIVCGAANNQLAHPGVEKVLEEHGILYAPDYCVNSGGLIQVADELEGFSFERAKQRATGIFDTTRRVFELAREEQVPPAVAADRLAEQRMRDVGRLRAIHLRR